MPIKGLTTMALRATLVEGLMLRVDRVARATIEACEISRLSGVADATRRLLEVGLRKSSAKGVHTAGMLGNSIDESGRIGGKGAKSVSAVVEL